MDQKNNRGFTLIELMMLIAMIGVLVLFIGGGCTLAKGNLWCTTEGLEKQLKAEHPEVDFVYGTERHVFDYSIVRAKLKDGQNKNFLLDSDILFNYVILQEE